MTAHHIDPANLPSFMTWEELESLPPEIAERVELWDGRVVWRRSEPSEHQVATALLWQALNRILRNSPALSPGTGLRAGLGTDVFLQPGGKSDFLTPDFLVYRRRHAYEDIRVPDVLLAGEVLTPSDTGDIESKRARYASVGIPSYWEAQLDGGVGEIEVIRAYGLRAEGSTPADPPLPPANYVLVDEWSRREQCAITTELPFPMAIPWSELEF